MNNGKVLWGKNTLTKIKENLILRKNELKNLRNSQDLKIMNLTEKFVWMQDVVQEDGHMLYSN